LFYRLVADGLAVIRYSAALTSALQEDHEARLETPRRILQLDLTVIADRGSTFLILMKLLRRKRLQRARIALTRF
jgi:hypothetical protein